MAEKTIEQKIEENKHIVSKYFKKKNLITKNLYKDIIADILETAEVPFINFGETPVFKIDEFEEELFLIGVMFREDSFITKNKITCYAVIGCEDPDPNEKKELVMKGEQQIELDYNRLLQLELSELKDPTIFEMQFVLSFLQLRTLQRYNNIRKNYHEVTKKIF